MRKIWSGDGNNSADTRTKELHPNAIYLYVPHVYILFLSIHINVRRI